MQATIPKPRNYYTRSNIGSPFFSCNINITIKRFHVKNRSHFSSTLCRTSDVSHERNNHSSIQPRFRSAPQSNSIHPNKLCNVCFKFGCWSTNYSSGEREKSIQPNRKIRIFFTKIDDDGTELDECRDGLQNMITHIQIPDNSDSSYQSNPGNIVSDN